MFKILIILTFSFRVFAGTIDEFLMNPVKFHGKEVSLNGEIQDIKKIILARDNFYTFKLMLKDNKYIDAKYYSIVDLFQINQFYCQNGYWTNFKGVFHYSPKGNSLGNIIVKEKLLMICTEIKEK